MNCNTYKVKIYSNKSIYWYLNDKLHREDGPAVKYSCGYKAWFINGKHHREDGPAIDPGTNKETKRWYIEGKQLTEEEFKNQNKKIIELDGIKYELHRIQ